MWLRAKIDARRSVTDRTSFKFDSNEVAALNEPLKLPPKRQYNPKPQKIKHLTAFLCPTVAMDYLAIFVRSATS
jgi:hypothetical protein